MRPAGPGRVSDVGAGRAAAARDGARAPPCADGAGGGAVAEAPDGSVLASEGQKE